MPADSAKLVAATKSGFGGPNHETSWIVTPAPCAATCATPPGPPFAPELSPMATRMLSTGSAGVTNSTSPAVVSKSVNDPDASVTSPLACVTTSGALTLLARPVGPVGPVDPIPKARSGYVSRAYLR